MPQMSDNEHKAELEITHAEAVSEPPMSDLEDLETSSVGSTESSCNRRVSLLYTSPRRGTGVVMDLVTGVANDMLQKGKEALESASNMKRDIKATVYDSLQGLYETVLSLSDSRNRHKCNLERERAQHAKELMRVERAHSKELQNFKQLLLSGLQAAHNDIAATLKETQAVRSWLGYEMDEPFKRIKEIREAQVELEAKLQSLKKLGSSKGSCEVPQILERKIEESLKSVGGRIGSLSSRLEILSSELGETRALITEKLDNIPHTQDEDKQKEEDIGWKQELKTIESKIDQITTIKHQCKQEPQKDLTPELITISEKLEIVSSELRTMREANKTIASPHMPSIETEIAVQEVRQTLDSIKEGVTKLNPYTSSRTFAQVAAKPRSEHKQQPNHTLIISSRDPKATSDNVLTKIRSTLDLKSPGLGWKRSGKRETKRS
ncbi:unnamed protein product [Euphydryas editha]|uniref:Uncharacterized protein n=1 Tax=Euphydryas editha TaxID=104508 RepID=A0AAU9V7X4_EUPED|nr:unnamed protein product [Euphydryas editha]